MEIGDLLILERSGLDALLVRLRERGYRTVGPTLGDGAIVLDEIRSSQDLPEGWTDAQAPGQYRLERRDDQALFGYAVSPHSWKRFLLPPELVLWRAARDGRAFEVLDGSDGPRDLAFIGVRPCEVAAIRVQDQVFLEGPHVDPHYEARRKRVLVVAANCTRAGGTCFCASMDTGPRARAGFDVALTELPGRGRHELLLEVGSELGAAVAAELPHRPARAEDRALAEEAVARAASSMGRDLDTDGLAEALRRGYDHPRWDEVGARCLACANCTMVCPTCFCTTVVDVTDLSGENARRERKWDSCFGLEFSYIHGGPVRPSVGARYRQWLMHKLSAWHDQFGSSGCVGCGRCITWCPVGIDITEEARAVRATAGARSTGPAAPDPSRGGTDRGD
jgi:formate hydrogenlyase subunit 6/NADH:ubiquinone oxidoreductase subunit I